jgi:uncharacterized protein DUF6152
MRFALRLSLAAVSVLFAAVSLSAHHSAVLFDLPKTYTVTGTMMKVDWRNPHVEIFVESKEANFTGTWEFETGAPSWFRNRNIAKADLDRAIGQVVKVEGVRAKDGSLYGYIYKITFADSTSLDLR